VKHINPGLKTNPGSSASSEDFI